MDVSLRNVFDVDLDKIFSLSVKPEQESFVDSNRESMEERVKAIESGLLVPTFAVMLDDEPVGFLMMSYGHHEELSVEDTWYLWRFMVDEHHQGRGIGRKALDKAISYMFSMPFGSTASIYVSYERENVVARKLYESVGFIETGRIVEGEVLARLECEKREPDQVPF